MKICLVLVTMFAMESIPAQDLDAAAVKKAVQSKNFVFKAQTAYPMGGSSRFLTPGYDLKISGDSLVTYLPYFGRAYVAPSTGEGPIRFTSANFSFKAKQKKKGSWEIIIDPGDTEDVREMVLRIFENGHATLSVLSNNRQSISFSGRVELK